MTSRRRGRMLAVVIGIIAVAALSAAGWSYARGSRPAKPPAGDPGELFARAREAAERPDVSEEERRRLFDEARAAAEARMDERINAYYAAKTPEDKRALLDQGIDEMEQRRREFEQRRQAAGDPPGSQPASQPSRDWRRRRGASSPQERKTRSESRSPDDQVRRMEYREAIRKRMQERGIQPPRWGPGGGGGGPGRG